MSFRRNGNTHAWWQVLVKESEALLREIPHGALSNVGAFEDYVTRGTHRGVVFSPSVFEISAKARADLFNFMNQKAHFDMDVLRFDHFNEAFRSDHSSGT